MTLEELKARILDIGAQLAKLPERRAEHALAAADGDKKSLREIDALDDRAAELLRTQSTLFDAVATLEGRQREAEAEVDRRNRAALDAEAAKLAAATIALDAEIDAGMSGLRRMFDQRAALLRQLAGTGRLPSNLAQRLAGNFVATAAARYAGLQASLDLAHIPPANVCSLCDASNPALVRLASAKEYVAT